MTEQLKQKLNDSAVLRWSVLALVAFTMLCGYFLTDVMSPLKPMLEKELLWDSLDYGFFTSAYGWFNVFLLMLIFGGMILDRKGARFTGVLAVVIMLVGPCIKYTAVATDFGNQIVSPTIFGWTIFSIKKQVLLATLGFAVLGVGIEMIGITANKVVVKWFSGRSLALAIGLNTATGRIGTAIAMFGSLPYAKAMGHPSAPLLLCLLLLCIGLMTFLVFIIMDRKLDAQTREAEKAEGHPEEDKFKFSDILAIARIRAFWYITILCILFYSAVFPFLKYATELMIQKFDVAPDFAGVIPGLLPFGNILLTPLFGSIYDHKGKGATIMVIGSVMLAAVHLLFAIPTLTQSWAAVVLTLILGAAFSLVPSAMWPSVAKIIPFNKLGTAYSMIFWIQNWGLSFVPMLIGFVLDKYCITGQREIDGIVTTSYDYTLPMLIFALCGLLSIVFALLLKREDRIKDYGLERPNIVK